MFTGIFLTVLFVILLLIVLVLCKRIRIAVAMIKEASKYVNILELYVDSLMPVLEAKYASSSDVSWEKYFYCTSKYYFVTSTYHQAMSKSLMLRVTLRWCWNGY